MLVNSKEYWDDRFNTNWVLKGGIEQSTFFYKLIVQNLNDNLTQEIRNNKLSICDLGCAEGEGVYLFSRHFPNSNVVGSDFSDMAISKAKSKYPHNNFCCEDMMNSSASYDILISSNVLEHFSNPYEIITKIVLKAQKYFVMLVPFNEKNREKEHFYTFGNKDIFQEIPGFKLLYYKIINCIAMPDTKWHGYQLFSLFQKI